MLNQLCKECHFHKYIEVIAFLIHLADYEQGLRHLKKSYYSDIITRTSGDSDAKNEQVFENEVEEEGTLVKSKAAAKEVLQSVENDLKGDMFQMKRKNLEESFFNPTYSKRSKLAKGKKYKQFILIYNIKLLTVFMLTLNSLHVDAIMNL